MIPLYPPTCLHMSFVRHRETLLPYPYSNTRRRYPRQVFDGTGRPVKVGIVVADVKPRELDSSATSNPPTDSTSTSPTDAGSADLRPVGAFGRMAPLPKPPQKTVSVTTAIFLIWGPDEHEESITAPS